MTEQPPKALTLSAPGKPGEAIAAGRVTLVLGGEPVPIELAAPAGPASVQDLLPILHGLSNFLAERAARKAEADGLAISCRAGCGACCRQFVPIAASEARAIAALVEAMPEPRRSQVRQRFEAALDALAEGGMLERLMTAPADGRERLGMDYFALGVACPFLEAESCSIHADRPLICREYLVTSPAAHCASPAPQTIHTLRLDAHPSDAVIAADGVGWLPLTLALRFAEQAALPEEAQTGPERLRELFTHLGDNRQ